MAFCHSQSDACNSHAYSRTGPVRSQARRERRSAWFSVPNFTLTTRIIGQVLVI